MWGKVVIFLVLVITGCALAVGEVAVSNCQNLDVAGETYVLNQDVQASGVCFNVTAANITMRGDGYRIVGPSLFNITGVTNVTLRDMNVDNTNISIRSSVAVIVANVSSNTYQGVAISLIGVNDSQIYNSTFQVRMYDGLLLQNGNNVTVAQSIIYVNRTNAKALNLASMSNCTFQDLIINTSGTADYGLYVATALEGNIFANNTFEIGSSWYGVYFYNTNKPNTLQGNTIIGGAIYPVYFGSVYNHTINGTTVRNATGSSLITFSSSSQNNLTKTTLIDIGTNYGVAFSSSSNNTIGNNSFDTNQTFKWNDAASYNNYYANNTKRGKSIAVLANIADQHIGYQNVAQLIVINATNITVEDQQFDNLSLEFGNISTLSMRNVTINSSQSNGIVISGSSNVQLDNLSVQTKKYDSILISISTNVTLKGSRIYVNGTNNKAIALDAVINSTLQDIVVNTSGTSDYGISISGTSYGNTLQNTTLQIGSFYGLHLSSLSRPNYFINTLVVGGAAAPIYISGSKNQSFENTTIQNASGVANLIYISSSRENNISNTTLVDTGTRSGVYLSYSYSNRITDIRFNTNRTFNWADAISYSNTYVNATKWGKSVVVIANVQNQTIDGSQQIAELVVNNVTNITFANQSSDACIAFSDANVVLVQNITLGSSSCVPLTFTNVQNSSIINSTFIANQNNALSITGSNITISGGSTVINGNVYGVHLKNALNSTLQNMLINVSTIAYGVYVQGGGDNLIAHNTLQLNASAFRGIGVYAVTNNNTFWNNTIYAGTQIGIDLSSAHNQSIFNNTIPSSTQCMGLYNSRQNSISHNTCNATQTGVYFQDAYDNLIGNNTITANTAFTLYYSENNTFSNNSLWVINVKSESESPGNTYSNNTNNGNAILSYQNVPSAVIANRSDAPTVTINNVSQVIITNSSLGGLTIADVTNLTINKATISSTGDSLSLDDVAYAIIGNVSVFSNHTGILVTGTSANILFRNVSVKDTDDNALRLWADNIVVDNVTLQTGVGGTLVEITGDNITVNRAYLNATQDADYFDITGNNITIANSSSSYASGTYAMHTASNAYVNNLILSNLYLPADNIYNTNVRNFYPDYANNASMAGGFVYIGSINNSLIKNQNISYFESRNSHNLTFQNITAHDVEFWLWGNSNNLTFRNMTFIGENGNLALDDSTNVKVSDIDFADATGLWMSDVENVSVSDIRMKDRTWGIDISDCANVSIHNSSIVATENYVYGLEISYCNNFSAHNITMNLTGRYTYPISIEGSAWSPQENYNLYNMTINVNDSNDYIIYVDYTNNITIANVVAYILHSGQYAKELYLTYTSNVTVANSSIVQLDESDAMGMSIDQSNDVQIINNSIATSRYGIYVSSVENLTFIDNTIDVGGFGEYDGSGLFLESVEQSNVKGNVLQIEGDYMSGILVDDSRYLLLEDNNIDVYGNQSRGISVIESIGSNTVRHNTLFVDSNDTSAVLYANESNHKQNFTDNLVVVPGNNSYALYLYNRANVSAINNTFVVMDEVYATFFNNTGVSASTLYESGNEVYLYGGDTSDYIPPILSIDAPLAGINKNPIAMTLQSDEPLSYCQYTINNWLTNASMTLNGPKTTATSSVTFADGSYTIKFWCADTAGNINKRESISVIVDSIAPQINVIAPGNTTYGNQSINLSVSANENLSACNYSLNNWATRTAMNIANVTASNIIANPGSGSYTAKFACIDAAGNSNASSQVRFSVDVTAPHITMLSPTNTTYRNNSINFSVSSNENVSACNVSLDNWQTNQSLAIAASSKIANKTILLEEGDYTAKFSCQDLLNNTNASAQVSFGYWLPIAPLMTITSVINGQELTVSNRSFVLIANFSDNITTLNYSVNGTSYDITHLVNRTTINATVPLPNYGVQNITFFMNSKRYHGQHNISFTINQYFTEYNRIIGNATNVYTENINLSLSINGSTDLNRTYANKTSVDLLDNGTPVVRFEHNFTQQKLNLTAVAIRRRSEANVSSLIISGLLSTNKTIYLNLSGNLTKYRALCVRDADTLDFDEISANCSAPDEYYINSLPYTNGGVFANSTDATNATVYVSGLQHSGVTQKCAESWSCSEWSSCDADQQQRVCADTNECDTVHERPLLVQSCIADTESGGSGGGGGGLPPAGIVKQIWPEVISGQQVSMNITDATIALRSISLISAQSAELVTLIVGKVSKPVDLTAPAGAVYQYVNITRYKLQPKGTITLQFRVPLQWLEQQQRTRDSVILMRYANSWQSLQTRYVRDDAGYALYEAQTPGFSYFAVVSQMRNDPVIAPQQKPIEIPITGDMITDIPESVEDVELPQETIIENKTASPFIFIVSGIVLVGLVGALLLLRKQPAQQMDPEKQFLRNEIQKITMEIDQNVPYPIIVQHYKELMAKFTAVEQKYGPDVELRQAINQLYAKASAYAMKR